MTARERVIDDLDGRTWYYPGLILQWARTSHCKVTIVIDPDNRVRMLGDWDYVSGVDLGLFASRELAEAATERIVDLLRRNAPQSLAEGHP